MPAAELHFFAPQDLNGSTIFECDTDDNFLKSIELDIQRDKLGHGLVNFARKVPTGLFTNDIAEPEVLVRVILPAVDPDKYLWAFFLDTRQQQVVSKAEKGGEGFTFGGPGPKFYLTRMILWSASFSGFDNAVEKDSGIWTWPSTARAGAILNRLILEDQDNPSGPFLPDLTKSFSDANDSNGTPWADDIAGTEDFTLKIRDDYLKILWQLEDASNIVTQMTLGERGDPLMQLDAYQSFGRDLTGDLDTDTVHFIEGVNIATDLEVEGDSHRKASHALVKGEDGVYELAVHPSGIGYKKVVGTEYPSSNNTVLDQAGRRFLARQDEGERQKQLRLVPGFDPAAGLYMPGPEGTDGHLWVGDSVSLTTGQASQTELDYDADTELVTGIKIETLEAVRDDTDLEAARSFQVEVLLNYERGSSNTSSNRQGNRGGGTCNCGSPVKLCRLPTEGSSSVTRLYPSTDDSDLTSDPAISSAWEDDSGTLGINKLKMTADGTYGASNQNTSSDGGTSGGQDNFYRRWAIQMDAALAAVIAAGGAHIHGQMRCRARFGIGISEASQDMISQIGVRVTQGDSTTIRGTALALHTLSSSAGSAKWPAQATKVNRAFPPAAASDVLSAVPGAAAGDFLIIETGSRNYTTVTTGGSTAATNDAASDLPEDEVSTGALNTWFDIVETGTGSSEGDLPLDTVHQDEESAGTSTRATRCDHQHAHGLLSADGTAYHSALQVQGALAVDPALAPDDGDTLVYDAATDQWVAAAPTGGGSTAPTFLSIAKWG